MLTPYERYPYSYIDEARRFSSAEHLTAERIRICSRIEISSKH